MLGRDDQNTHREDHQTFPHESFLINYWNRPMISFSLRA